MKIREIKWLQSHGKKLKYVYIIFSSFHTVRHVGPKLSMKSLKRKLATSDSQGVELKNTPN